MLLGSVRGLAEIEPRYPQSMPRGFFTQALVILLREPAALAEVQARLSDFQVVNETPASDAWELSGPSLLVAFRPEVNGYVAIDTVDHPWPDDMGDPKVSPMRFAAWSMGHFGPFAYPNGLLRAVEQAWNWPGAAEAVGHHRAFLRLKLSYVFGAEKDARIMPPDCDPRAELEFLTALVRACLALPSALCWFDPSGELLLPAALVEKRWELARANGLPAHDLWSNVRLFKLTDGWCLMDTVGNWQLDLPDMEAVLPPGQEDLGRVDGFLRDATEYLRSSGATIKDGDTMDGPDGARWRGYHFEEGISDPPRSVLRWFPPEAESRAPAPLRPAMREQPAAQPAQRPWWKVFGR